MPANHRQLLTEYLPRQRQDAVSIMYGRNMARNLQLFVHS